MRRSNSIFNPAQFALALALVLAATAIHYLPDGHRHSPAATRPGTLMTRWDQGPQWHPANSGWRLPILAPRSLTFAPSFSVSEAPLPGPVLLLTHAVGQHHGRSPPSTL